jgi:hypothetical protein
VVREVYVAALIDWRRVGGGLGAAPASLKAASAAFLLAVFRERSPVIGVRRSIAVRRHLVVVVCMTAAMVGHSRAPLAAELELRMRSCSAVVGRDDRLSCYDSIAADLMKVTAAAEQKTSAPARRSPSAGVEHRADDSIALRPDADSVDLFGREMVQTKTDRGGDLHRIESTVTSISRRPRGEHVFVLDNGQVWAEISPGRALYRSGARVFIERTRLGAYMLSTDAGKATRVRRLE